MSIVPQNPDSPLGHISPEHLDDLRRSGLTDKTISEGGFRTLTQDELRHEVGALANQVKSAFLIPYPGANGFHRVKLFPSLMGMKYSQPRGSACRFYMTPGANAVLKNPAVELFVIEGEKKALRLHQEGIAAIGVGGIWNWRTDKRPIDDFGRIDWCDRRVTLVPDSDTWTRDDLRQAVFALAKEIESRGGKAEVLKIPQGDGDDKVGADDYLQANPLDAFLTLPRYGVRHSVWSHTREWWREWIKSERQPSDKGATVVDVIPATEEVDGSVLFEEVRRFVSGHIVMKPEAALATALWIFQTWTLDAFTTAPILNVTSPAKRCGKTRLLEILGMLVKRPLAASNFSTAAVFRSIDKWHPTLLIDEADTFLSSNDELRGVLNSSHYRSGAFVVRCAGDDNEPTQFSTWSSKVVAGIGKLKADTLEDRSIRIPLERKARADSISHLIHHEAQAKTETLRRKLARWSADYLEDLRQRVGRIEAPADLDDRQQDNWRPLLAISELVGARDEARTAAVRFAREKSDEAAGTLLLQDFRELFKERGSPLTSEDVTKALGEMEERPWPEWRRGQPISAAQIARLLAPFGVGPHRIRRGGNRARGYEQAQFREAFERYLEPPKCPSVPDVDSKGLSGEIVSVPEEPKNNGASRVNSIGINKRDTGTLSRPSTEPETPRDSARKPYAPPSLRRLTSPVEVLRKFGGRLQRAPLLIAIRRESACSHEQAEAALDVQVDEGAIHANGEWYEVTANGDVAPGAPQRPLGGFDVPKPLDWREG